MTSTLELKLDLTEQEKRRLEALARQNGVTLQEYVRAVIEGLARQTTSGAVRSPPVRNATVALPSRLKARRRCMRRTSPSRWKKGS